MWVVVLMAHNKEHARINCQSTEVWILKAFFEPHELLDESHVRISTGTSGLYSLIRLIVGETFCQDHVSAADRGRARDALNAVDINFATSGPCIDHELQGVVEDACYVFTDMIFQVIALVDYSHVFVIVITVVCGAVDNMRNS